MTNRSILHRSRVRDSAGKSYQSAWEREAMAQLRMLERAGRITGLEEQVTFALYIGTDGQAFVRSTRLRINAKREGVRIEAYRADAVYYEGETLVIVDAKNGFFSHEYKRKARWMDVLGYPVTEMNKRGTR